MCPDMKKFESRIEMFLNRTRRLHKVNLVYGGTADGMLNRVDDCMAHFPFLRIPESHWQMLPQ